MQEIDGEALAAKRPGIFDGGARATRDDFDNEEELRAKIAQEFECKVEHLYSRYSPIDFYVVKRGRLAAFIEVKRKPCRSDTYSTFYLDVRKFADLIWFANSTTIPVVMMIRYEDCVKWINVQKIDVERCFMLDASRGGNHPVIAIAIEKMNTMEMEACDA